MEDGEESATKLTPEDKKKQALKEQTNRIVTLSLDHVLTIPNLIKLAHSLNGKHEFVHVITTGKKCQERIFEKQQEFHQREELKKEFERLDNLRLQQLLNKDTTTEQKESVDASLEAAKEAVESIPKGQDLEVETKKLNDELLQVTELIISAAKIENLEAELRSQTIMAFKADTTTARWDQVRHLTPEDEWAQVKEELVVYVLKQNTNINEKIELLLKDGLYKQVIEVFPKPRGTKGELQLLTKVYRTIEEKEAGLLEKMIPVVSRYMKRYFQEQKYSQINVILDRFQRRFPGVVVSLLTRAVDMVMFDIMPSQYSKFVQMLTDMKHRLQSINRHDDWNNFFLEFKKKHIGKKKLIQMVNLIGDSVWDLDTIMDRPKKRQKTEHPKKEKKSKAANDEEDTEEL